jgi:ABC-type branched-subunit amino acid transport system permease subunit
VQLHHRLPGLPQPPARDYFAIATLGFSEAIRLVLNNTYEVVGGAFGYMGMSTPPPCP